jgi:hypothetical protein
MKPIKISGKIAFRAADLGWKGSQQRCLLITSMGKEKLQEILLKIIGEETVEKLGIKFPEEFEYYPKGFINPTEIQLDKRAIGVGGSTDYCASLNKWWLKKNAKTPTWDLVCNAEIGGPPGLILVEAKAHKGELINKSDKLGAEKGSQNYIKIAGALDEFREPYGYKLKYEECYQMSNRIAWGIKLASIGIPVVLIYLGFEHATEMEKEDTQINNLRGWISMVKECSKIIDFDDWEKEVPGAKLQKKESQAGDSEQDKEYKAEPSYFYPIIRTANVQLDSGEMSLKCNISVDESVVDK